MSPLSYFNFSLMSSLVFELWTKKDLIQAPYSIDSFVQLLDFARTNREVASALEVRIG